MVDYYELREKLEHELETEVAKIHGEMTPSVFCTIKDLLCAIQYAATISAMDEASEPEKGYSRGNSYNSYARGRTRDSMGRYSGANYNRMGGARYYRDDHHDHLISQLETMMNEATTDRSREAIRRAVEALEME